MTVHELKEIEQEEMIEKIKEEMNEMNEILKSFYGDGKINVNMEISYTVNGKQVYCIRDNSAILNFIHLALQNLKIKQMNDDNYRAIHPANIKFWHQIEKIDGINYAITDDNEKVQVVFLDNINAPDEKNWYPVDKSITLIWQNEEDFNKNKTNN